MFYITQIYGKLLNQAISFTVHIQSNMQGKITYVADLGIGRGYVVTASNFENLIKNIMNNVHQWKATIYDDSMVEEMSKEDIKAIREKINEWYGL